MAAKKKAPAKRKARTRDITKPFTKLVRAELRALDKLPPRPRRTTRPCSFSFICEDCNTEAHIYFPMERAPLRKFHCPVCGAIWQRHERMVAHDTETS